jgi:RNA polymerase sigma-70 factor, ECF subfamily
MVSILSMDSDTPRSTLGNLASLFDLRQSDLHESDLHESGRSPILSRITLQSNTDEELVTRLRAGETDALTVLFERHSALTFRIARRILRNEAEAENAVQEVFLDLFRSMAKFDPAKGTFKVWLLMYAYHRALNYRRRLQAARFYELQDLEDVLRNDAIAGKRRRFPFQGTEAAHLLKQVLAQIQPRQREVIELVYYEGCTAEEVAIRTGDSAAAVRHNLYRGMEKLRSILNTAAAVTRIR